MGTTYTIQKILIDKYPLYRVMNTVTGGMHSQWLTYVDALNVSKDLNRMTRR